MLLFYSLTLKMKNKKYKYSRLLKKIIITKKKKNINQTQSHSRAKEQSPPAAPATSPTAPPTATSAAPTRQQILLDESILLIVGSSSLPRPHVSPIIHRWQQLSGRFEQFADGENGASQLRRRCNRSALLGLLSTSPSTGRPYERTPAGELLRRCSAGSTVSSPAPRHRSR